MKQVFCVLFGAFLFQHATSQQDFTIVESTEFPLLDKIIHMAATDTEKLAAKEAVNTVLVSGKKILQNPIASEIIVGTVTTYVTVFCHDVGHKSVENVSNGVTKLFLNPQLSHSLTALVVGIETLVSDPKFLQLAEMESALFQEFVGLRRAPRIVKLLCSGPKQILNMEDIKKKVLKTFSNLRLLDRKVNLLP